MEHLCESEVGGCEDGDVRADDEILDVVLVDTLQEGGDLRALNDVNWLRGCPG